MDKDQGPSSEVNAMAAIEKAFAGLDAEAQKRVLRWAADRFGIVGSMSPAPAVSRSSPISATTTQSDFATLAELYSVAQPSIDAEKALVVGYWLQFVNGQQDLEAQSINDELKQLGHGVANITKAFEGLMDRKPQLAVQTRKSGTTRQARKKYRVTEEGRKTVLQMLNGTHEA